MLQIFMIRKIGVRVRYLAQSIAWPYVLCCRNGCLIGLTKVCLGGRLDAKEFQTCNEVLRLLSWTFGPCVKLPNTATHILSEESEIQTKVGGSFFK